MDYEFLSHTADVKFKARGNTIEEMFLNAAYALNETIKGDVVVLEQMEKDIEINGTDNENLLYNFLEEFLVLLDSEDFLLSKIKEIKYDKDLFKINVKISGDKAENYKFTNDVKAITFNEMYVKKDAGQFVCQVVLDV